MPTNKNEPVWSSGPRLHTGGGNGALVVVPVDQDLFDVTVEVAAATTAQVEVTHDSYEAILGIDERPLRYAQVAINDLGGSGELRMNAAAGQDFTDDGWAVGDTFEVISHKVPAFGPGGTHPTSIADKQVYTVSSVAALVLAFSEDPAFSLAEGDIVVAQSRAAVAEDSLNWGQIGVDVAASTTDHFNISTACAVRVIASGGTGDINYNFAGRMQSVVRPAPFVPHANPGPFGGPPAGVEGIELVAGAAPVWAEDVEGGPNGSARYATATVAGTDFDVIGVKKYDKVNFSGHSQTGNTGGFTVRKVVGTQLQMFEPLKGSAGTDDARVRLGHYVSSAPAGWVVEDYHEFMLQLLTDVGDHYWKFQEQGKTVGGGRAMLDDGPAASTDLDIQGTDPWSDDAVGPFGGQTAYFNEWFLGDLVDGWAVASEAFSIGGWFKTDDITTLQGLICKAEDLPSLFTLQEGGLYQDASGDFQCAMHTTALAQPSDWVAATAYVVGDRVQPIADPSNPTARVVECEVAGTSSALLTGSQAVDYGAAITGPGATGLANDATVYNGTVTIDGGGPQTLAVTGSLAQDFDALIVELDIDTTGGAWTIIGGDLVCTSTATGETSSVLITDGGAPGVFSTTPAFVAILAAVPGDGEPTWPAAGSAVVDGLGALSWRVVSTRDEFHNVDLTGTAGVDETWYFVVASRETSGDFVLYIDGVEAARQALDADDTAPGSFGTPKRRAFTIAYMVAADGINMTVGAAEDLGVGANVFSGESANVFIHRDGFLTAAEVQALYDTAVNIGLN